MPQRDFKYKKIPVQQVPAAFNVFEEFFNQEKFDYILEIGSSYGGLSLFLHEQSLIHDFKFITHDISNTRINKVWSTTPPFNSIIGDCFEESIFDKIVNILENNKCLILCDGGNKIKEFNTFSKYISIGSYIAAHDYAPDKQIFKQEYANKIWNWHEIQDSDVIDSFDIVNKSNYYEVFRLVAWLLCIKK